MVTGHKQRGFTLIELIMVIMVLSAVSVGVSSFIHFGVDIYRDAAGRDRQIGDSRFLIERISRELREALPNSVRVNDNQSCIEFVPIVASSSYIDIPVMPELVSKLPLVVLPAAEVLLSQADKLVIYPLHPSDIYVRVAGSPPVVSGKVFELAAAVPARDIAGDAVSGTLTLKNAVQFSADSPTERYYLIKDAVSYCVEGTDIKRHSGYWSASGQASPPTSNGVLMAQRQSNSKPFVYHPASLTRSAMVQLNFEFSYDDELLKLYHEVHVVNVP